MIEFVGRNDLYDFILSCWNLQWDLGILSSALEKYLLVLQLRNAWWQTPNTYYFKHLPSRVIFEPGNSRGRSSGGVCTVPIKKGWLLVPLPIRFQNAREMYKIAHSIWLFWLMFTLRQYIQEHTYLALLRWHLLLIPHSRYSQYIQCLPTVLLYQT